MSAISVSVDIIDRIVQHNLLCILLIMSFMHDKILLSYSTIVIVIVIVVTHRQ